MNVYKDTQGLKMGKLIKIDFSNLNNNRNAMYKNKLIRIRDEIEEYLLESGLYEDDELAVALASGRFAIMKLTQMTGENETIDFVNDCINTTLKDKHKTLQ